MSDQFVTVTLSPFFTRFREQIEGLQTTIVEKGARILRQEEESSIRKFWYRTGTTLRSLKQETVRQGDKAIYRLWPTTFYSPFGEYGTGRRGARTGQPAPRGWRYGTREKGSMEARRFSRRAVETARPKVIRVSIEQAQAFARNVTVK